MNSILAITVLVLQITSNAPKIKRDHAFDIANAAAKYSKVYKVPANVMLAIARVESSYNVNAFNFVTNDYGLYQINMFNIKAYKFDKDKILSDIDYATMTGFKVFSWFYNRYPLDEAIMRYNCGTRKNCIKLTSVQNYLKKVKKHL